MQASPSVPVDSNQTVICTITNTRRQGTIQVVKDLIPSTDPGLFDLKVERPTVKAGAVDGDSGSAGVAPGNHTVSETGAGTTSLTKYTSSIECKLGTTTVASGLRREPRQRPRGLEPDGDLHDHQHAQSGHDPGRQGSDPLDRPRFDSTSRSTARRSRPAPWTATRARPTSTAGNHTVSETGAGTTDLAKYTSSIECKLGTTTVASGSGASLANVPVDSNQTVICTITNTRNTGTIEVVKSLSPTTDPGKFNLQVDGTTKKTDAGNGGTTGRGDGQHGRQPLGG